MFDNLWAFRVWGGAPFATSSPGIAKVQFRYSRVSVRSDAREYLNNILSFPFLLPRETMKLIARLVALVLILLAGCAKHHSDSSSQQPPPGYQVSITSTLPLPPRTPLCGVVTEALVGGSPPAQGVRVGISRPGAGPFFVITDLDGRFCISPAGFVSDDAGLWTVVADGSSGHSAPISIVVSRYEFDIAISRDIWLNGERIAFRVVRVVNNAPTTTSVNQATFTILRFGVPVEVFSTGPGGVAFYTSNLVPGEYTLWARDDQTNKVTPLRQVLTLPPTPGALGASTARSLDNQGLFTPAPEWWDRKVGVDVPIEFVYYTSQSSHSGGSIALIGATPATIPIGAGVQGYRWTPTEPGDWIVQLRLLLPAGESTSLWRRVLVAP